jgi:glyoxylase-like metal-dependent hydrolase (beta-lactamase superfamily II)
MLFRQFHHAPQGAYSYLLADTDTREAVAVDPIEENLDVLMAVIGEAGLVLRHVLLSHVHPRGLGGAIGLRRRTGARIVAGRACDHVAADQGVDHGDSLIFGEELIHVIGTPGHTPCSVCYRWHDRLFTGDTLLIGSCGEARPPEGNPGRLFDSVTNRLFVLPAETLVYPGFDAHGRQVSTIGQEKVLNERFAGRGRDAFVALMASLAGDPLLRPSADNHPNH